jgi:hypothetical protein
MRSLKRLAMFGLAALSLAACDGRQNLVDQCRRDAMSRSGYTEEDPRTAQDVVTCMRGHGYVVGNLPMGDNASNSAACPIAESDYFEDPHCFVPVRR